MQTARTRRDHRRFTRALALGMALGAFVASGIASAAGTLCNARSPAHRVALVELYSSEGCNSCPPADNWLSQWKDSGATQSIVPLALHVDYWNGLGWTDRFSQHRFTERQQTLTDLAGGHTIYTPEIFVAGRELRSWSQRDSFQSRIGKVVAEPAQANVALQLTPHAQGSFNVDAQFTSKAAPGAGALNAYLAVYENSLSSHVGAGENSGATLHHERVVRQWIGPVPLVAGSAQIRSDIRVDDANPDANAAAPADRFGVVAFVENAATGDVLQVAELAACR
ncbi:hypothetical protein LMG28614_01920 [Paraburkholderia ultramafica]|uniref:DUF1223 domain-containing protein n=1 Tax=Paraburkholderia ultramafica TaxID=1544867 RepID=A0A6S7B142_9BURK|nr:DUF1223 domain-containing protein [Paraburkholderia ultramafica]CAB3784306.1 hypothetical protein LMG28614_01920 [Paraburkholderia ultramafica]